MDAETTFLLARTLRPHQPDVSTPKTPGEWTPLRGVLEALKQERDSLAESRIAVEATCAQRLHELERQWEREREAKYRQLAEAALIRARETVQCEFTDQTQSLAEERARLEEERRALATERRELQPAEMALQERLDDLERERRTWEEQRLLQTSQLKQEQQELQAVRLELEAERQRLHPVEASLRERQIEFDRERSAWATDRRLQIHQSERAEKTLIENRSTLERDQEKFHRDRAAWEEYRLRQFEEIEAARNELIRQVRQQQIAR